MEFARRMYVETLASMTGYVFVADQMMNCAKERLDERASALWTRYRDVVWESYMSLANAHVLELIKIH
jgi:hypothetical protein